MCILYLFGPYRMVITHAYLPSLSFLLHSYDYYFLYSLVTHLIMLFIFVYLLNYAIQ